MIKHYVFWGIFALVLIGIGVTLIRRRNSLGEGRTAERIQPSVGATTGLPAAGSPAPEAAFDASATRIHFRAPATDTSSVVPNRDQSTLPAIETARLVCVGGVQKGHSFSVPLAGITVGRDPQNDLVIADPRVSYRHAWVGLIDRRAVLRDLGSTNGTYLNAQIDTPVREVVLSPGDTIFFGGHGRDQFRFVVD